MIFIICTVLGILGVGATIWLASTKMSVGSESVPRGAEWFRVHPEGLETSFSLHIRERFRGLLKIILIWLIGLYRKISRQVTVKQTLKKKVREFLYDHTPDGIRHPSVFWHKVKHVEMKDGGEVVTETVVVVEKEE